MGGWELIDQLDALWAHRPRAYLWDPYILEWFYQMLCLKITNHRPWFLQKPSLWFFHKKEKTQIQGYIARLLETTYLPLSHNRPKSLQEPYREVCLPALWGFFLFVPLIGQNRSSESRHYPLSWYFQALYHGEQRLEHDNGLWLWKVKAYNGQPFSH